MRISKLPQDVKSLALKNHSLEIDENKTLTTDDLNDAFHWDDTPEGFDFWADVHVTNSVAGIRKAKLRYEI